MKPARLGLSLLSAALIVGCIAPVADAGWLFGNRHVNKSVSVQKCVGPNCQLSAETPNINAQLQTNDGEQVQDRPEDGKKWYTVIVTRDNWRTTVDVKAVRAFERSRKLQILKRKTSYFHYTPSNPTYQRDYAKYVQGRYPAVILINTNGHVYAAAYGKDCTGDPDQLALKLESQAKMTQASVNRKTRSIITEASYPTVSKQVVIQKEVDGGIFRRHKHTETPPYGTTVQTPGVNVDVVTQPQEMPFEEPVEPDPLPPSSEGQAGIYWVVAGVAVALGALVAFIIGWNKRTKR